MNFHIFKTTFVIRSLQIPHTTIHHLRNNDSPGEASTHGGWRTRGQAGQHGFQVGSEYIEALVEFSYIDAARPGAVTERKGLAVKLSGLRDIASSQSFPGIEQFLVRE